MPAPSLWPVLFGLETEIGISIVENPGADVVEESIALVRSATQYGLPHLWDYTFEDPHQDARGFRAKELLQDTDEANYFSQDTRRELTFAEIKSDLVLRNGARFYNDHAHPEFSTPECATLRDLIAQDKAGERILEDCALNVTTHGGRTVRLYKNNTDFLGHSYGCHDNYLIARDIPWERVVRAMTPFLVTRQIFAGAGKVGYESEDASGQGSGFQISQRADFFTELVSIDTMNRRPLINTRDEPHADNRRYRRFHVIIGDANMAQYATWLKVGTTALVLEALAQGEPPAGITLADPLLANRAISHDANWQWPVTLSNGRPGTAISVQRAYLEWVKEKADLSAPEKMQLWNDWAETLDLLERDPLSLRDRLDWPAKRCLLDTLREAEGLDWSDPWLQSIDLEYHLLDREAGLFYALEAAGQMRMIVDDTEVLHAVQQPPNTSRAYIRGRCVQRFAKDLNSAQWDNLVFNHSGRKYRLDLRNAFTMCEIDELASAVDSVKDVEHLIRALNLPAV
ncbi:MAG TPA: proteasome accessory factor PafA2 family protein [Candidatus Methylacidiphilales bacterium]|nr:proteasome accessory factor PafA2 family protein [Candidatus Methylacidiphilales bacterium]